LNLTKLKKIRIGVSLFFFLLLSFLFIDPRNSIPTPVIDILSSIQLVPAVLMISTSFGFAAAGLFFIIILTLLFGRVYCSTICPLGTFQDIVIYIKKKTNKRYRFSYLKPSYAFHYFFLGLTFISVLIGSSIFLNLLEPFSNYGRLLTTLIEPLTTLLNNGLAAVLSRFQIYSLYDIPLRSIETAILFGSIFFSVLITYLSYLHGRLFCNSFCPAGAILGLLSRLTVYKIVVNEKSCTECGACEKVCKANCIESKTKKIDFSACIGCFNCIKSCPTDGIIYTPPQFKFSKHQTSFIESRRLFLGSVSIPLIGSIIQNTAQSDTVRSGYWQTKRNPVSPPGSRSVQHFSTYCTACSLCVTECPTQVLYPSFVEYGVAGLFQPKMNYDASYCNYECTTCGDVCPTGAILPLSIDKKKLVQIGKAVFIKDDCVVAAKKKDCAACSEHCPTKAVYTVPYEGKLKIPELNNDICIGCGACEHACPTTPRKAIYITPNSVHLQAQKPKVQKQEKVFDIKEDFPF
jgi:ferredoxin